MNKAVIVRPEGLADNVDLHQVVCGRCGYEGLASADRHGLISERNMHECPKVVRAKKSAKPTGRKARRPEAYAKVNKGRGRGPGRGKRR